MSAARRAKAWRTGLLLSPKGDPRRSLANVMHVLALHPNWTGVLAYDEFAQCVITRGAPPMREQDAPQAYVLGDWTDEDSARTAAWFAAEVGFEPDIGQVDHGIAAIARKVVVHPVRDWLRSLTWDGKPRLDAFVADYLGGARSAYSAAVGRRWLIAAVARVFRPGSKVDSMLVLEGVQGIGKSSALRVLAGTEWFADTGIEVGHKDSYQSLRRKWVYEFSELASIRGREIERVKNFLSSQVDTFRASFGRRTQDHPRQVVFAGSTNELHYLNDPTGARRFWPVRCTAIELAAIVRDREQLWAEARAAYEANEPWHLDTADLRAMAAAEAEDRTEQDAWLPLVGKWLEDPTRAAADRGFTTAEVLTGALGFEPARIDRSATTRVGIVLRSLGLETRGQEREGVTRVRRYYRVVPPGCDAAEAENGSCHNVTTQSGAYVYEKQNGAAVGPNSVEQVEGCDTDLEREAIQSEPSVS